MARGDTTGESIVSDGPGEKKFVAAQGIAGAGGERVEESVQNKMSLTPCAGFMMAVWFGLAAGLLELSLLVCRVAVLEKGFFLRSQHFLWMVPLSDLLIYASVGLVLALWLLTGRRARPRVVMGLFLFLTLMSQLLLVRGLNLLTCLLISLGVALRTAGWFEKRLGQSRRLIQLGTALFLVALTGLAAGSFCWERYARLRAETGKSPVPGRARNVLLIVLDTVRADHLSLYGYGRDTTPNLRRLAEQGARFDRARATAPWTLPSHASLFTGRWPHELGVEQLGWLDATFPTLAEFLGARGYSTAGFVANQFFCGHESGLSRGYSVYRDYPVTPAEVLRSSTLGWFLTRSVLRVCDELRWSLVADSAGGVSVDFSRKDAAMINREFLGWLSDQGEKPFFAFLNYFDAHDPYLVPAGSVQPRKAAIASRAETEMLRDWFKVDKSSLPPRAVALARDAYDDCIAALDFELGKLFDQLKRRGVLDETLLILTADHGEQFGENGSFGHGQSLHAPEVHVPLVIVSPAGVPRGRIVPEGVSLRDIPATIIDLLGDGKGSPFPGLSLARTWQAPQPGTPGSISPPLSELHASLAETDQPGESGAAAGPVKALLHEKNVYIHHQDGDEELYAVDADPAESRDLSQSNHAKAALERCRLILDRLLVVTEANQDASPPDEGKPVVDQTARLSVGMSKILPTRRSGKIEPELDRGH
jgi:arylsulfatase A-like enzyme